MDITPESLKRTALYDLHLELGAKMVPFAGYQMPVQYPMGGLKEHAHTRTQAGLFDVSHMGQIRLSGADVAAALEALVPVDILGLRPNTQRYAVFTNESGGILDDLMVTNSGDHLLLVVNAACKHQDLAYLQHHLPDSCAIEALTNRALLALQGPQAAKVLARFAPKTAQMLFMQTSSVMLAGFNCVVSRSGYTGEDGFEISVSNDHAEALARLLLAQPEVAPVGLGARDSLRLEAGLCLYGHDLNVSTTPVEASLVWALSKVRRADQPRGGGYPGAEIIQRQLAEGVARKRVGLLPQDRVPVREGAEIVNPSGHVVGIVTSGGFGPTVGAPVAMGYVETAYASSGSALHAIVRGKPIPVVVTKMPFTPQHYYRG
ncbi:glycine cleavage system aminomethyltransferase GcvT [Glaciimonas immobilis]|uniref:aminomethyltransferase n=1 Tax=Glaciimonas immobilis TaxID=728004 RepID=A0A840RYL8_9BURK|nr:glycine cleavage system aminomethyltransferase GcvT [Glaciimonas immobilis]KAF3998334.1 glycine cleavage system aminomethyltransferase GcvT [Glaciimonas immobilis]MBB5201956.1 aminomethyltransferase [Glaciimonas immobilis]